METEIERMIVRLIGDGTSYQTMLQEAGTSTQHTMQQVESTTKKAEASTSGLMSFAGAALSGLAALGIGALIGQANDEWDAREQRMIRMNAVLSANGRNVEEVTAQYQSFAASQAQLTTASAGSTMNLLRQAETFGLTGDAAMEAARNAQALAAVNDGEASSYLRLTQALVDGDTKRAMQFARMVPQLRGIKDETEFLNRANQLFATGMAVSAEMVQTNNHQMDLASRAYRGFLGDLGQVLDEALLPYAVMLKDAAMWLRSLDKDTKTFIAITLGLVGVLLAAKSALWGIYFVWTLMTGGVTTLLGLAVAGGVGLTILASKVGGLGVIAQWVMDRFRGVFSFLNKGWQLLVVYAKLAWSAIRPAVMEGVEFIKGLWNGFLTVVSFVWDMITAAAMRFWAWIRPAVVAGILFIGTMWNILSRIARETWDQIKFWAQVAWEVIKQTAQIAWDSIVYLFNIGRNFVAQIWGEIAGDTQITWVSIVDIIQHAFIAAEFIAMNFQRIMDFAWLSIQLGIAEALDFVITSFPEMSRVVIAVIYAIDDAWDAFVNNMMYVAERGWNFLKAGWAAVQAATAAALAGEDPLAAFGATFNNTLRNLNLSQERQWRNIGAEARNGFQRGMGLEIVDVSALGLDIHALRAEWIQSGESLIEDFEAFRDRRVRDIANFQFPGLEQARGVGQEIGTAVGEGVNDGMGKEVKKLEATSIFGADSLSKIDQQLRKINGDSQPRAGRNRNDAAEARAAEGVALMRRQLAVQERIANRPPVELRGAGL